MSYIYIYRERERERDITKVNFQISLCLCVNFCLSVKMHGYEPVSVLVVFTHFKFYLYQICVLMIAADVHMLKWRVRHRFEEIFSRCEHGWSNSLWWVTQTASTKRREDDTLALLCTGKSEARLYTCLQTFQQLIFLVDLAFLKSTHVWTKEVTLCSCQAIKNQ